MTTRTVSLRRSTLSAILSGAALTLATAPASATPEPAGLFRSAPGLVAGAPSENAIAGRSVAVSIDHRQLAADRLFLKLPGGGALEAVREHRSELGHGRFAWVGHAGGNPGDRVVLGVSGDAVAGTIAHRGQLFKLEPRADGSHILSEVGTGDPAPALDPIPVADTGAGATDGAVASTTAAGTTIDVLVAYTPTVQSVYGTSGAEALIVQAVAESNQAYANSGISARLNLVDAVLTPYAESGDMGTDLSRLRGKGDGYMDELHTLRDSLGADVVSLIEHEPASCGIGYLMTSLSTGFASSAFNVVHRTCATGYYSFAHEIGHNQGAHHDQANATGGLYSYSYGYQNSVSKFRTVMAYNCSGGCKRVDHFSNPAVLYNGAVTGLAGAADNAQTLNRSAATVAAFRQPTTQSIPAAPGDLSATAQGATGMALSWRDQASDESGFRVERSLDGVSFGEIASLAANATGFSDSGLATDTLYHYRVRAWNSAGASAYSNVAVAATGSAAPLSEQVASGELAVAGTVSGSYRDTWQDDGATESIVERQSGGRKASRYGYLEHVWTFEVVPGDSLVLSADVTASTTADAFTFAYSTDNASYVEMFTVDAASPPAQQFTLPPTLQGRVFVRVRDRVRQAGVNSAHSVRVDHLAIRAADGQGGATPAPEPGTQPLALEISTYKSRGLQKAALDWRGDGAAIDIYRDGVLLDSVGNSGSYLDEINQKGGGSYRYRVCAAGTSDCSAEVTAVF